MMINKLAIVSLSAGVLGEDFVQHELEIGLKRLTDLHDPQSLDVA